MARIKQFEANIFISWSGKRAGDVASALKTWIPDVFLDVKTWTSSESIDAGMRWNRELEEKLAATQFGILCLTPENKDAPWILFEAGALAKAVRTARVVPYLLGMTKADLTFPLAQFQAVDADEAGTMSLLLSINSVRKEQLSHERVARIFERSWPDLKRRLNAIAIPDNPSSPRRSDRELLEEILELTRQRLVAPERKPGLAKTGTDGPKIDLSTLSDSQLQDFFAYLEYEYSIAESKNRHTYYHYLIDIVMRVLRHRNLYPPPIDLPPAGAGDPPAG
jgi:hypothetical protein